jgi:hypothetical protein
MVRVSPGLAAGLVVVLAGSSAAGATFQKLTDTSLVAPDKQPIFTIAQPQLAGNRVIFMGATSTPSVYIFSQTTTAGSKPLALVSNKTKVPGGVGTFTGNQSGYFSAFESPACPPPVIGTTKAVFIGRDSKGNAGIYSVPLTGGAVAKLVDFNTKIPGGPVTAQKYTKFNSDYSFCNLSISGETVAFDAGGSGVYTVQTNGTKLTRIADANTPATGPDFKVDGYAQPNIKGTTITYVGSTVFGPYGIFVGTPTAAHVRSFTTSKPEFAQFTYPTTEANGVLFSAKLPNSGQGLFNVPATGSDTTVRVVDTTLKPPKGTPGTKYSNFGSNVTSGDGWTPVGSKLAVFAATTTDGTNSYAGLFSRCNVTFSKLLAQNEKLGGVEVTAVSGVNYLAPVMAGGKVTGYKGALLIGGFRYAAVYTMTIPAC